MPRKVRGAPRGARGLPSLLPFPSFPSEVGARALPGGFGAGSRGPGRGSGSGRPAVGAPLGGGTARGGDLPLFFQAFRFKQ